jgi:excisionase family DNA binding protein
MERHAYTVDETAEALGISRDLIYDLMKTGSLSYIQVTSRKRLITREQLDAFKSGQQVAV